jgi:hypothetical protein
MLNYVASVLLLLLSTNSALAVSRNCTASEKETANQQLLVIKNSSDLRESIIARHLPFGAHHSTLANDNAQLLFQNGYVMSHDPDLRTAIWSSYRLDASDIQGASGQDRVNCFRRDPRLDKSIAATPADYNERNRLELMVSGARAIEDLPGTFFELVSHIVFNVFQRIGVCGQFNIGVGQNLVCSITQFERRDNYLF